MDKNKKKPHIVKKYSLCFPFRFEHLVISSDITIEYLTSRALVIYKFNSKTKSSLKFGINSCLKLVQSDILKAPLLVFIFYDESLKLLIDMMIIKCKDRENTKLYLIDKSFKSKFCSIFQVKKLIAFCVIENDANSQVFKEIIQKYSNFEQNTSELIYDTEAVVKEVTTEK